MIKEVQKNGYMHVVDNRLIIPNELSVVIAKSTGLKSNKKRAIKKRTQKVMYEALLRLSNRPK
jgi:hypothetical protein